MITIIGKCGKRWAFETLPGGKIKRISSRRGGNRSWRMHGGDYYDEPYLASRRRPIGMRQQPIKVQITHLVAATSVMHDDNLVICLRDMNGNRETVRVPRKRENFAQVA